MKPLNLYIQEKLIINQRFDEKLIINKNYKQVYSYAPKSCNELREIIKDRYNELGPGTEQKPIDFNDIDVSELETLVSDNKGVFEETKFEYIDISNWDVSSVKNMENLFQYCDLLKSVGNLSKWKVSNVEHTNRMFSWCRKLESVGDLSNWNVSEVKDMSWMFHRCEELQSVGNLSRWKVSKVEDMYNMFTNSGITNIPGWYKE